MHEAQRHHRSRKNMTRRFVPAYLIACLSVGVSAAASGPEFEIADVHVSPKAPNQFMQGGPVRNGRYELHRATMLDLVRIAYGFDSDKILGGPNWLEMTRYDVVARMPADTAPDAVNDMLKSLLADRFKLVVHKDTKPLPTYALTAGKKLQLKEADGTGETGCKVPPAAAGTPADGTVRLSTMGSNGTVTTVTLGPGMVIQYNCRNMTMESFASGLRNMMGASLGPNPVLDQTGLKGIWSFDVRWSMQLNGPLMANVGERITLPEAVDKQLGLKLEQQPYPTPVIVVDSVNEKPTANPSGVAEALPAIPTPTAFEVADIKPTAADFMGGMMRNQPGGRVTIQGMTLQTLLLRAFSPTNGFISGDAIIGAPGWANTERFDITAKAPSDAPGQLDPASMSTMLRSLLEERFGLKSHTEERPMSAYTLVAGKPKMKKAEPSSRTGCKYVNPVPAGTPPGTQILNCQNVTMSQFADQLQNAGPGLNWPVLDATGVEGGWDFTLSFSRNLVAQFNGGGPPPGSDAPSASDPGGGFTIFEAVDKQLGLKLEMQKRPVPVIVIDHLEEKPTAN